MKTADTKQTFTEKLRGEYEARTIGEQLTLLDARPGKSERERNKLLELLKVPGVSKRTSIKEARELAKG